MMWNYIYIDDSEEMLMSGWKLYVSGRTLKHAEVLAKLLIGICRKYNMTAKVATQSILDRNKDRRIAWSVAVLYLKPDVFRDGKLRELVTLLNAALQDYHYESPIKGALSITTKLHCRYDLNVPINPSVGVNYQTYLHLYRGEYNSYNIKNNRDEISISMSTTRNELCTF